MRAHAIDPPIFKHMSQLLLRRIEVAAVNNPERYIWGLVWGEEIRELKEGEERSGTVVALVS